MAERIEAEKVSLEEVFSPRGVAVVGASGSGRMGFPEGVLMGLIEAGCPAIYPVNPKYKEIMGLACYPDLTSIPGIVDFVVVSIPATGVMSLLDDCAKKALRRSSFLRPGLVKAASPSAWIWNRKCYKKPRHRGFESSGPIVWVSLSPKASW